MTAYENDTLIIPEKYKKLSVSELEKEKKKLLEQIKASEKPRKITKNNKNNIVFNF